MKSKLEFEIFNVGKPTGDKFENISDALERVFQIKAEDENSFPEIFQGTKIIFSDCHIANIAMIIAQNPLNFK